MTVRWFRFYEEVLNDPKVQSLSCEDFRAWVNLLCLVSSLRATRDDNCKGQIPDLATTSFGLRMDEHACSTLLSRLLHAGLIDPRQGGTHGMHYAIHGWEKRQYKSDTSTERVKRFRNGGGNVPETARARQTTDSEKKEKKKEILNGAGRKVFIERDTPEWHAWQAVKRREGVYSREHGKNGWWFDTQWPPGDENVRH